MDTMVKQRLDELAAPKRNNYFYGKLLDEMHLRLEQDYFYGKRALLNRLALGSGVLCGLRVAPDGKFVTVSAGVAIDGFGREVIVPEDLRIDVSKVSTRCDAVRERKADETPLYLKLCYRECRTDFEPALVSDCLPQQQCAASTIVESYCVELGVDAPLPPPPHNEALCTALRDGKTAEAKRDLVNGELAKVCGNVAGDGCIALATIHLDAGGSVTDAKFDPPQHVYSNAALFDMLLCLGEGGKGDPGVGLDKDLPKILDIGWNHNSAYQLHDIKEDNTGAAPVMVNAPGTFASGFYDGNEFATREVFEKRLLDGTAEKPLFTVYFNRELTGIDANTFIVRLKFELMIPRSATDVARPGIFLELPIVGDVLTVKSPPGSTALTPHTQEPYAYVATFIPRQEFLAGVLETVLLLAKVSSLIVANEMLALANLSVEIKGDFITTGELDPKRAEHAVLDANNIGGWVGSAHLRDAQFISGGKNPSGNLTQGGTFESWLRVGYGRKTAGDDSLANMNASDLQRVSAMVRSEPESLPVSVNAATRGQLEAAGLSAPQVERILEHRRTRWFAAGDDLQTRARVNLAGNLAKKITF